jgi:hypothetical protein
MLNAQLIPATSNREARSLALRTGEAALNAFVAPAPQIDNGDEALYSDKSGTYTKGVVQDAIGVVNPAAYIAFKAALASGSQTDFANIPLGGVRTLNGPQGGLAFYLKCLDCDQFGVPPAPALASEAYATELVELYWASLLRDTAFTEYPTTAFAQQAATELTSLPAYAGPKSGGIVTPNLLFRGTGQNEQYGPYISQFLLEGGMMGAFRLDQKYFTNKAGQDFMLDPTEFQNIQNGKKPTQALTPSPSPLYLHDGRGLAAYTHNDILYQAYYVANVVLNGYLATNPTLLNPGNPYAPGQVSAKTQNGFATMGGPDIAATLAAVAGEAARAVWYQKWWVHLRHRPESGGGIVYLMQTGSGGTIEGNVSNTVIGSKALAASFAKNNSWLLSQAFPEGSPTHPAYPTGHGTVAGACITALKFFYNGDFKLQSAFTPQLPRKDGSGLDNYVPPAGEPALTLAGELNKLASNISFGHGIHAGIHWRSDTLTSIQLGEAVALSYLRDQARTYNEKFSVTLSKYDGTPVTISNL